MKKTFMRKHWIFHKYKWETYNTAPVFVIGFFQDYTLQRRFQTGNCPCGAYKYREIDVDVDLEMKIALGEWKMKVAEKLKNDGRINDAIEVLKL